MSEDQREESPGTPEWKVPLDEQLETSAYHVWKPRPLLRSVHWKPVPAPAKEAALGSYDVFIDQRVFKALHQQVWNAAPGEQPFGFLVGDLCEDPDSGRRYVIVSATVPSRFPLAVEGVEQIPGEALVAMQLEVDRRRGVLAGWYRRHASGEVALTAEDVRTHETLFGEPWQVALLFVTDHANPRGGCFRWTRAGLAGDVPLPFFEMVSNESLLARGVRRSNVDWLNVETVDSIEADLPPRPEPVPEPEVELEPEPKLEAEPELEVGAEFDPDRDAVIEPVPVPDEDDGAGVDLSDLVEDGEPGPTAADGQSGQESVEATDDADSSLDDFEILDVIQPDEPVEPLSGAEAADVSEIGFEEMPGELEVVEEDLTLPVVDDVQEIEVESDVVPDLLPEPGWDSEGDAVEVSLPAVDDMDLESFVEEVASADLAAEEDEAPDLEAIEPAWDEPEEEDELPVLPAVAEEPPESVEPAAEPTDDIQVVEELPGAATAAEPGEVGRPARSRRPLLVAVGLVAIAIAVSLLVFVLPSGSGSADPEVTQGSAAREVEAGPAEGEPPPEPAPDAGEGSGDEVLDVAAVTDTTPPSVSADDIERLGDALLESISRYYGLAVEVDGGEATCAQLQPAYVEVEDRWIAYNVQGRAGFRGRLPDELTERDERLYAGVQDVEREFNRSGCPRP